MYALLSQIRQNIVMYDVLMPPSYLLKRRDVSRRNIIGFYPSDEPPRKYQFSLSQPDWQTRDVKRTAKSSKRLSNIHSQNDRPTFSKVSFRLPVKSKRTSNVRSESSDTYTRTFGTYVAEKVFSPRKALFHVLQIQTIPQPMQNPRTAFQLSMQDEYNTDFSQIL